MRVIFIFLLALVTTAQAQQINPVPDYIFRNQMSVGRNAVTDTAAYMSVGPRYGAVKGFMPPIVTDTNSVTGVKRNGLLIFSLQLNNFAYWDSTTARFRKITAEASVDSLIYSTRAWRKKGDDSLGAIIAVKTDTGLISTKAYRQKGIDSVVTLISTLGGGTVLSVSAGTGMNFSTITTSGAVNADTLVLSTRAWRQKGNDSIGAIVATKVNISDTASMLGAYLRKADTTAMIAPYLRKVDTTAMLGNYVRAAGYGLTKGTQIISADTAAMATRARVQKGIDSVSALFTSPDTLTLSTRAWRQKGDDSLGAIIGTKATATGTTNYLSKFTGTSALGNSIVYATTSEVGISTPSPTHTLDVNGRTRVRTIDSTGTGINMLYSDVDGVIKKAAIPAGGSGTVTSVATGYGLTGGTITTTGTLTADTLNLSTKAWRQKGIDSVASVRVGGTGTTNRVAKFTASGTVGNSGIADSSSAVAMTILSSGNVGIATAINRAKLSVAGIGVNTPTLGTASGTAIFTNNTNMLYGLDLGVTAAGDTWLQPHRFDALAIAYNLHLNPLGGNVGIANQAPSYKLDISGTLRNTTGAAFATSSGNVLVGTTTDAAYKFDVVGTGRFSNDLRLEGNGIKLNFANPGYQTWSLGTKLNTTQFIIGSSTTPEALTFINTGGAFFSSTIQSAAGANFATSSGNVGIGTTSPATKFNVEGGNIRASATTNNVDISPNGVITITSASGATIDNKTGTMFMQSPSQIIFRESGGSFTEWVRVKSTGFGVGVDPTQKLDVDGRARVRTIDSTGTGTGMNMLYADVDGVIKKAAVPSGGSGTVTSVATGFGLSGGTITTTGTLIVDSASVATRARVQKGIDSVASLTSAKVGGTGISGYFPKWTGASTQDTSQLFQLGRNIGIGTASPTYRIHLPDAGNTANQAMIAGSVFGSDGNGQTVAPSSGAMAYYGQGSDGYLYGAQSSGGKWGVNTRSVSDAVFNVNGDVKIVTIDSTSTARNMLYQDASGVIKKSAVPTVNNGVINTSIAVASANYTVTSTDHFVYCGDLSSAGRNIVLPTDAVAGRQLIFFNTSNHGSHRWTFTNEDVLDINGDAVTTLANRKTYTLVFYEGVFYVISVN